MSPDRVGSSGAPTGSSLHRATRPVTLVLAALRPEHRGTPLRAARGARRCARHSGPGRSGRPLTSRSAPLPYGFVPRRRRLWPVVRTMEGRESPPRSTGTGRDDARMITNRTGPYSDSAAATLGLELIEADAEQSTVEVGFTATDAFTTPRGDVLEGFLAAMLHDTVGPALLATLGPGESVETHDLNSTFVAPAYPGRLVGRGHVVRRDGNLAFVEAALSDTDNRLVAMATATLRVVRFERRQAA